MTSIRAAEAARKRETREAQKRYRELERRAKELAKLSQIEQARLEVETYESRLDVLLSIHKERGGDWDWSAIYSTLAPVPPQRRRLHGLRAKLKLASGQSEASEWDREVEKACAQDEVDFKAACESHAAERAEWEAETALARRIMSRDHGAYSLALERYAPFSEIAELGSSVSFIVHNPRLLECALQVNGMSAIPSEVKSLTSTGKLSVKAMPRARFHEIYQDYLCGCVLRVAREIFAFLPVETVLITASAELHSSATGNSAVQPVLSVAISRFVLPKLNFDTLDPSDAVEALPHRGDFKATRKSGAFQPIAPLTPADVSQERIPSVEAMRFDELLAAVRRLRREVQEEIEETRPDSTQPEQEG